MLVEENINQLFSHLAKTVMVTLSKSGGDYQSFCPKGPVVLLTQKTLLKFSTHFTPINFSSSSLKTLQQFALGAFPLWGSETVRMGAIG